MNVGEYARSHGYSSTEGSNCGIDYFVGNDGSIIVTEINARWTGGLFPAEILRQLDTGGRDAVPFFDIVSFDKREAYTDFLAAHLVGHYDGEFAMVPMGFGPFPIDLPTDSPTDSPTETDGNPFFYTWQIVLGNLEAFKKIKQAVLGEGVMPTADRITLP